MRTSDIRETTVQTRSRLRVGIVTGISGVPTALTIQKGNIWDKTHMRERLNVSMGILDKGSLFMHDCGGNSPWVKDKIVDNRSNYLTLKAKKV